MVIIFRHKEDAINACRDYASQVKDDVYVKRHANGREYRLWTRKEMLEFQSDYIEHFHKYNPSERAFSAFNKLLKENGVVINDLRVSSGKIIITDYDDNVFEISVTKKTDENNPH